jgi:membrane protein implicated in regulation of membrane protease activity
MDKILVLICAGLVLVVALCALGTAAMSAAASAANSVAMATMAATLQTSQCAIVILALAVILTPVSILFAITRLTGQAQTHYLPSAQQTPAALPRRRMRVLPPPDPEAADLAAILRDWSQTDEPLNRR